MRSGELSKLVDSACANNQKMGITGLLLYSGGHFIQILEGDGLAISSLFAKISRDPRHKEVKRLFHKVANQRLFPDWGMQLVNNDEKRTLDWERVERALVRLRLSPGNVESEAIALIQEFRQQFVPGAA